MKAIKAIALVLLLLASMASASLSSDQVREIVGGSRGYLNPGESASLLVPRPLEIDGEGYWISYFYQTSSPDSRNLYLAVSDNTGFVEKNPEALKKVFAATNRINAVESLKTSKASIDDLDAFLQESESKRESVEESFYRNIRQQLESKYPQESFTEISTGLEELKQSSLEARDAVRETRNLKAQFELYGTMQDFDVYYDALNLTYGKIADLSLASEKYRARVFAKVEEVTNSPDLNFSAKQEITAALEKLFDTGDYDAYNTATVEPAVRFLAGVENKRENFVNNNVESTLYRIARKSADYAYSAELKQQVSNILAKGRELELRACGVDPTELKAEYAKLRATMENPSNTSRQNYETVPEQASKVQTLADEAAEKLNNCVNEPTPPPAQGNQNLVSNILIVALIAALAYYGFTRYKKWREESQ